MNTCNYTLSVLSKLIVFTADAECTDIYHRDRESPDFHDA
jgi:hypothetical protein